MLVNGHTSLLHETKTSLHQRTFFCRITSIHWQAQSIQEINGKKIKMDNFVKKSSVFYNKSLDEIYI